MSDHIIICLIVAITVVVSVIIISIACLVHDSCAIAKIEAETRNIKTQIEQGLMEKGATWRVTTIPSPVRKDVVTCESEM